MRWYEIFENKVEPNNFPWHMPLEYREEILSWTDKIKSPYSHSYYDVPEGSKSWDHTPMNSLRISDHWNFQSRGATYCKTDQPVDRANWALGKWNGEVYTIISQLPKRRVRDLSAAEVARLSPRLQRRWQKSQK